MAFFNIIFNFVRILVIITSSRLTYAFNNHFGLDIRSLASSPSLSLHYSTVKQKKLQQKEFAINNKAIIRLVSSSKIILKGKDSDENVDSNFIVLAESDQTLLGTFGTLAGFMTLYSEFTLKTTGCGLPAGPFGLVGAVEGISYLTIIGIAAFAAYAKIQTGNGLPAGPVGLLGLAQQLSIVCISAGLLVLGFQIMDYGYIPNAVPMEGGMCQ